MVGDMVSPCPLHISKIEGGFNNEQANWFGTKKRGLCGYKNLHIEAGGQPL